MNSPKKPKLWELREKAQSLRKMGKSFSEIRKTIPVTKSTLSYWCQGIILSDEQRERLRNKKGDSMPGIKAIQKMYWAKQEGAFTEGRKLYDRYRKDPLFTGGLMAYWAEGRKTNGAAVTNSDPRIIALMVKWFEKFFSLSPKELVVYPHIHSGQKDSEINAYWSKITKIPLANFRKSFTKPEGSGYKKNILYNGTVGIRVKGVGSTYLLYTIFGATAEFFKENLGQEVAIEEWITKLPYA